MFGHRFYKSIEDLKVISNNNFKKVGRSVDVDAIATAFPNLTALVWTVAIYHKNKKGNASYRCMSTLPDGKMVLQDFYEKQM